MIPARIANRRAADKRRRILRAALRRSRVKLSAVEMVSGLNRGYLSRLMHGHRNVTAPVWDKLVAGCAMLEVPLP